jgi:3-dehydroquinate synthase
MGTTGTKFFNELSVQPQYGAHYSVLVGSGLRHRVGDHLPDAVHRSAVVADSRVYGLYGEDVLSALDRAGVETMALTFPEGESNKTRQSKRRLEDRMLRQGLARDGAVVALGGGVTTDLAGFVAATYMRGIPYLSVPTTLLAMVDATVGGKTGVNTPVGKNLVGAFHQPCAVLADLETLKTLPREERVNGLAEMVKHAMIADSRYMDFLCTNAQRLIKADPAVCGPAVVRSVAIKAEVVAKDTHETNLRQVLNFGHTVGHALEKLSGYKLSHGRAVGAGMAVEAEIAVGLGVLDAADRDVLVGALKKIGLKVPAARLDAEKLLGAMASDKKGKKSELIMSLPRGVGRMARSGSRWGLAIGRAEVISALNAYSRGQKR